ncbi:MAG TPA: hypothetical protein VL857_06570 [Candidatus Eisenbacteria bacterium]|jgi:hypothetical protein|nr:hypothetical protein [Candidatus Eisenbacteria bacterium]
MRRSILARTALVLALAGTGGCAAASQLAALQQVEFRFDHIGSPMLAGVPLERTHSYSDFTTSELTKLAESVTSGLLPMELTVHVTGRNPESNSVTARLVAMDWVYLVDDRETVSGRLTDPVSFKPGVVQDIPLRVGFDMMSAFDERGRSMLELALALAGQSYGSHKVMFRITPTVETPAGPIQYPVPLSFDISSSQSR